MVEEDRFIMPNDLANSFKSLTYEEIRRTPGGFEDIGRVVQVLPGVSFVNDGRNDLIVRGGSPTENLFLVDNTIVPNINHFGSQGATGGPVSIINLEFVREVDFLTGGFSARYGDKLSSVLDIKFREGNREKFLTNINLSATGFGAVIEGPFGSKKKGSWLLSVRKSYLDFIFKASGFGFVPEYSSAQFKGVYDFDERNSLTVNAIGNIDKVTFNNDDVENRQDNENILKNNQNGYVNSYEPRTILSRKSFVLFNLGRTFTNFDYSGRDAQFVDTFTNKSKEGETGLKTEYFLTLTPNTQIQAGGRFSFINFENDIYQQADTSYFIDPESGERYVIPELSLTNDTKTNKAYLYTQFTQNIFKDVQINLGLRYDYFEYLNDKNYIAPRASLEIPLNQKLRASFAYGIFYQSPAYLWLAANEQNRNLKEIKADHYVAGLEYLISSDVRMTLEAYYKNYSDYPVSTLRPYLILGNNGGNFEKQDEFGLEPLVSAGTGFARGIEFFIQKALTTNFYGLLNFSLYEAKYKALDGIERQSSFDNTYLFTVTGGYKFGDGWEAAAKFRLVGGRPYTPIDPLDGSQLISEYNSERLPDYSRLDIRVDKTLNFKNWTLVTYLDIQDVLNKKNVTGVEWNIYTRSFKYDESIGLLPTIGINAIF
ncbi:MAG: TonB-dependent receptor plug domain-containing protein [Ignavibacteria bacterium]|nr:TonB-dependent receptor plug domain-containing protein [Ignavibacteria bacterium]